MSRVLVLALLLAAPAAQAQSLVADVKACRQLAELTRRVACYDAMKLPGEAPVATEQVAKFGQQSIKPPAGTPPPLNRIESRILGKFLGWGPNKRLELENGQVWRIADDSEALYELQDPKVIVHRGLLGAFYLEIEGVPFQVRVVRAR